MGDGKATIGLCMIVRDEAEVIERCLRSVRPLISSWVICDTGSTDGTPGLIERTLEGLPGSLHRRPWRDFGANRTEGLELARGSADYLLLLDADHTLRVDRELPELVADAYLLRHDGDLDYAVPRLVRGDRRWRYEGSTHEYLAADDAFETRLLEGVVVEHHADGGRRAEKFERDRRLLEQDVARRPDDARAVFYLAQTLRDLGEHERAIELYRRRVELGGWEEEVFYAALQIGVLLAEQGAAEAVGELLAAWSLRPSRAEPLHELARFCRGRGWHEAAYLFASRGLEIPYPDDTLFVHRDPYEWGLLLELSIAAHSTGRPDEALRAGERLLTGDGLPPRLRWRVGRIRNDSLEALGRPARPVPWKRLTASPRLLSDVAPSATFGRITLDVSPAWPQFNPTIAADGDGYRVVTRTSNYEYHEGDLRILDGGEDVRTLNYLVRLDPELALVDVRPLVDGSTGGPPLFPSRILGFEDCRLIELDGGWYATATVRDRNPEWLCETVLLRLDGAEIGEVTLLRGPEPGRHEKNWMPFVRDGRLHFLYWCDPLTVLRCDPATGAIETVTGSVAASLPMELRGGSQGLPVDGGWLFAVHEAATDGVGRSYTHRLVLLDHDLRLAALSPPFRFLGDEIEFCAGLAARGEELLFAFGTGDRECWLALVDGDEALGLLEPLPAAV